MGPQRKAELWHWGDVTLAGAVLVMAIVGLIGHYRLRTPYAQWHELRRIA